MISLMVNGKSYKVDAPNDIKLLWVLRDYLNLTGTKFSCGIGECGSCTVLINGEAQRSCTINAEDAQGADITTIEGLPENHPVKKAWIQEQVVQCGAKQIMDSMDDVICRCGTYHRMKRGVKTAVEIARKEG